VDESIHPFVMPQLTTNQRAFLFGRLTGQDLRGREYFQGNMHGTLRKSLINKGLARPCRDSYLLELTDYGRQVAEHVKEQEIRLASSRMTAALNNELRQADADMRTPPSARPGYKPQATEPHSAKPINARLRQLEELYAWLRNPARLARIEQLRRCGHHLTCPNCAELSEMWLLLERALITLAGEADLSKLRLQNAEADLVRIKSTFLQLVQTQKQLLRAIAVAAGVDEQPANQPGD
jgi:hypothetical protein